MRYGLSSVPAPSHAQADCAVRVSNKVSSSIATRRAPVSGLAVGIHKDLMVCFMFNDSYCLIFIDFSGDYTQTAAPSPAFSGQRYKENS
jgi:hypothetical protein